MARRAEKFPFFATAIRGRLGGLGISQRPALTINRTDRSIPAFTIPVRQRTEKFERMHQGAPSPRGCVPKAKIPGKKGLGIRNRLLFASSFEFVEIETEQAELGW